MLGDSVKGKLKKKTGTENQEYVVKKLLCFSLLYAHDCSSQGKIVYDFHPQLPLTVALAPPAGCAFKFIYDKIETYWNKKIRFY